VLLAENPRSVSSQDCNSAPYPDYDYKNPLRNFWNPNLGTVTVKIDQMFTTQYSAVPDAAARIEAGQREWNGQDICAPSFNFADFGTRSFSETEYNSPAPVGRVYWLVSEPNSGSYAGITANLSSNRVVSAIVKVSPNVAYWTQLTIPYTFNHLGSHEIGHSFNLKHCTGVCTPYSIMGGATFGPDDAIGPGICDIQKVRDLYCPSPCEEWCDFTECWNCIPPDPCTYPNNGGCPDGYSRLIGRQSCCSPQSPIVVDVSGNGINLTDTEHGVVFDISGNGTAKHFAWTSPGSDDAWLVLDRNHNGTIDNGTELFGNFSPQPIPPVGSEKNGFLALAEYDKIADGGNNDGRITSVDSIFPSLRLWQDINHNGISESSELKPLNVTGLSSIELDYNTFKKTDEFGNVFRYRAKVTDLHGTQMGRWAWDVFLVSTP
jgi:hypothetical protein